MAQVRFGASRRVSERGECWSRQHNSDAATDATSLNTGPFQEAHAPPVIVALPGVAEPPAAPHYQARHRNSGDEVCRSDSVARRHRYAGCSHSPYIGSMLRASILTLNS